jgi:hypothetical protein
MMGTAPAEQNPGYFLSNTEPFWRRVLYSVCMPSPGTSARYAQSKRYYERHKARILADRRARRETGHEAETKRERIKRNLRMVQTIKEVAGCQDCKRDYPACVLDFDHVSGEKVANIAFLVSNDAARALVLAEVEKCEVVCANCHRLRTERRKEEPNVEATLT